MQLPWLEELTKKGHITEQQREDIYADCREIVKTAATLTPEQAAENKALADYIQAKAMPYFKGLMSGVPFLVPHFLTKWDKGRDASSEVKDTIKDIEQNRARLLSHPDYAEHQEKVNARFNEIASLAPTVARHYPLVSRLMKEKLHSGLTSDDVSNLAIIQSNYTPKFSTQQKMYKKASGEAAASICALLKEVGILKTGAGSKPSDLVSKAITNALVLTAGPVFYGLGRGAIDYAADARSKAVREKNLRQAYENMMREDHPHAELFRAQPEKARQAFQALAHFSPGTALEPVSARTFVSKMLQYKGDLDSADVKTLTEIEKNLRGSPSTSFFKSTREGLEAAGFRDAFKGSLSPITGPYTRQLNDDLTTHLKLKKPSESQMPPAQGGAS